MYTRNSSEVTWPGLLREVDGKQVFSIATEFQKPYPYSNSSYSQLAEERWIWLKIGNVYGTVEYCQTLLCINYHFLFMFKVLVLNRPIWIISKQPHFYFRYKFFSLFLLFDDSITVCVLALSFVSNRLTFLNRTRIIKLYKSLMPLSCYKAARQCDLWAKRPDWTAEEIAVSVVVNAPSILSCFRTAVDNNRSVTSYIVVVASVAVMMTSLPPPNGQTRSVARPIMRRPYDTCLWFYSEVCRHPTEKPFLATSALAQESNNSHRTQLAVMAVQHSLCRPRCFRYPDTRSRLRLLLPLLLLAGWSPRRLTGCTLKRSGYCETITAKKKKKRGAEAPYGRSSLRRQENSVIFEATFFFSFYASFFVGPGGFSLPFVVWQKASFVLFI